MTDYHTTPKGARIGSRGQATFKIVVPNLRGGLCAESNPDAWFPTKGGPTKRQKTICHQCPIEQACRDWALDHPGEQGIWGGLTEQERIKIRRKQQRTPPKVSVWRCGHPKTPENTAPSGTHGRCRTCHNQATARSRINRKAAA